MIVRVNFARLSSGLLIAGLVSGGLAGADPAQRLETTSAQAASAEAPTASSATAAVRVVAQRVSRRLGLPPREPMSAAERSAYFAELRELYQRPSAEWPAPTLDAEVEHRELGLLPPMEHPAANPPDAEKAALGKLLFYDPRLSGSGQIACASCHDPDLGWGDGRTVSFGHNRRELARNAPSVLNSGYRTTMFWDGRAPSLEQQAKDVLANADEMHSGDELFIGRLAGIPGYVDQFRKVFGIEQPTIEEVALALAAFERTVVSSQTRFDSFVKGNYRKLSDEELSGLHLFRTDARCLNCHNGPVMTDDKFHNIGLSMYGRPFEDLGRFKQTGLAEDVGAFRTPSLRDITRTEPYMHNGLFDMDEVLRLYNAGMPSDGLRTSSLNADAPRPIKSPLVKPLGLNEQDLGDLAAFLATLSEPHRRFRPPQLPKGL
ncbi:cytochrome-c peroxidase [Botrimarina hoheduenensis]|uniref:Methylamine utilization protein MauG n=1 Tax=Botrimarina hoheduenensis TaxID=2528000 RepID=A0A5C5VTH9_9BACT|nr:cytochrome c peroxidase [Botrimarina hoheduenensis]TWT40782.1 Cytochrome c551 peroxidase precursor [Botrimarina hoheduenensis]